MATLDPAVSSLAALLRQTPPGQVAKVYNDLRVLLESQSPGVGDQLRAAAWSELGAHNAEQLITVKTTAGDADSTAVQPLIISPAGAVQDEDEVRFVNPRTRTSYAFDPLRLRLSDPQDVLVHDTYDRLRSAIDSAASKYVGEHYQDGVTMTFIRTAPVEEDTAQQQTGPAEDTPASSETDGDAQATEARSDLPAVHEAHAGSAPDVDDVRRSEAALKDPAEQDVAGNAGAGRGEADSSTFATVEAAVDQAEAAAQEEFQTEQAEAHSQQEEMGDTLLSRQMAETHIGPQGAEQETNIEATECGDPEASLGSAGMAEAEGVAEPHIPATKQIPSGAPTFTLHIVGNRYNLANYWAGRWRSTYILSLPSEHDVAQKGEITALIKGKVQIQVHYFEDGNVQLSAEHAPELPVDTSVDVTSLVTGSAEAEAYSAFAEDIVRVIKQDEQAYQAALETTLSELLECTFRALRRQLPVTKQKLDWNRAVSYNLTGDLAR